jgi:hypothetical protein
MMRGWYTQGHLEVALRVRTTTETTFTPINQRTPPPSFTGPPPHVHHHPSLGPPPVGYPGYHPRGPMAPSHHHHASAGGYPGGAHQGSPYGGYHVGASAPSIGGAGYYGGYQPPAVAAAHHSIAGHRPALQPGQLGFAGHAYAPPPAGYDPAAEAAAQEAAGHTVYQRTIGFNARDGRMTQGTDGLSHWAKKGLPEDRAGRQMARYFDVNQWQGWSTSVLSLSPILHLLLILSALLNQINVIQVQVGAIVTSK